jgi:serine O-acetyltransferase
LILRWLKASSFLPHHVTTSRNVGQPQTPATSKIAIREHQDHHDLDLAKGDIDSSSYGGVFESKRGMLSRPYVSSVAREMEDSSLSSFLSQLDDPTVDPLWEQVKLEAMHTLENEPSAGPQLYTLILSQPTLIQALTSIVSHEIETELIPATSLHNLFIEMLDPVEDSKAIELDVMKSAMRSSSEVDGTALNSVLFHQGLHALVCHRLAHRLWLAKRTGLAYYIQSTVSRKYSSDIHPAARFGCGIYLNAGSAGVVIGETAVVDHDVTILQGVTLGGTGKERGDRHPKVARGAILQQSCSVLGNIPIGEGAIITAKSIVTKPVPAFARVSGVPGKVKSFVETSTSPESRKNEYGRNIFEDTQKLDELETILMDAYLQFWKESEV